MWMKSDGQQLAQIANWIEEGKIVPLIDKVFQGIEEVDSALRHLESGHCTGKVVVRICPEETKPNSKEEEDK